MLLKVAIIIVEAQEACGKLKGVSTHREDIANLESYID